MVPFSSFFSINFTIENYISGKQTHTSVLRKISEDLHLFNLFLSTPKVTIESQKCHLNYKKVILNDGKKSSHNMDTKSERTPKAIAEEELDLDEGL